ncbi:hypothetical protein AB0F36_13125 [Streptomyces sp. NPDC029080]|uniref:hypothetical protein n=1 Tax=Streptomyces sp. NPDC029080 TaxID=3155017 RepID=UPI0033D0DA0A
MASTRTKSLLAGGVALLLCLAAGVLYALGLPPFKDKKGEIEAAEVCRTLGSSSSSAAALKRVLPDRSSYAFQDAVTDPRRDDMDSSYSASCFVNGDGKLLVSVTAEMAQYDETGAWVKDVVANHTPASSVRPFSAGDKAIASERVAAIYLPCVARASGPHLSVVVQLQRPGDADAEQLRQGLISLVRNTALHAHQNAKCDAPSKVTQ